MQFIFALLSYGQRNSVRLLIIINLQKSKMQQRFASQSLKTLGNQRVPVRLRSQSMYFRQQRGIRPKNEQQSLLGTTLHPKVTSGHPSTTPNLNRDTALCSLSEHQTSKGFDF